MCMVRWNLLGLKDTTFQERTDDRQSLALHGFHTLPECECHFCQDVTHASSTVESGGEAADMRLNVHGVLGAARLEKARSDRLQTIITHDVLLLNVDVRGQPWIGFE